MATDILNIQGWTQERVARCERKRQQKTSQVPYAKRQRRMTMKVMIVGIVAAVDAAAMGLLEDSSMSEYSRVLVSLIGGSFGLLINVALFDVGSPKEIARQALASIPTAGLFAPFGAWVISKALQTSVTMTMLLAVSGAIGMGGTYILKKYGRRLADAIGSLAVKKVDGGAGGDSAAE